MTELKEITTKKGISGKINPLEMYTGLDSRRYSGSLKSSPIKMLEEWFHFRQEERDLIFKLNSGEDETLIGLLILQSKLNLESRPCIFLCRNSYFVDKVRQKAAIFGIQYCIFNPDRTMPIDFIEGKKILIANIFDIFNKDSIFNFDKRRIDTSCIILKDSIIFADLIRRAFTIKLRNEPLGYKCINTLFADDLKNLGEGSFLDVEKGNFDIFYFRSNFELVLGK